VTEAEKFYINENRMELFDRDNWTCQICGEPILLYGTPQAAHKIKQAKHFIQKYGRDIIHHPENIKSVCSLECNAKVDLGNNWAEIAELAERIKYMVEMEKLTKEDWF
jgi:5-methylcytosine-specific restriction endonuclease McrA